MNPKGLSALGTTIQILIWFTVVFAGLATVFTAIILVSPSVFDSVSVSIPIGFAVQGTAGSVDIGAGRYPIEISHAVGYVTVRGDSRGLLAIVWLFIAAGTSLAILAGVNLRRLVDSAARGEPFEHGNQVRVRRLGLMAIGMGLLRALYLLSTYLYTVERMNSTVVAASLRFDLGISFLIAGFVLLALGEVFDRGEQLQQDHDLTV